MSEFNWIENSELHDNNTIDILRVKYGVIEGPNRAPAPAPNTMPSPSDSQDFDLSPAIRRQDDLPDWLSEVTTPPTGAPTRPSAPSSIATQLECLVAEPSVSLEVPQLKPAPVPAPGPVEVSLGRQSWRNVPLNGNLADLGSVSSTLVVGSPPTRTLASYLPQDTHQRLERDIEQDQERVREFRRILADNRVTVYSPPPPLHTLPLPSPPKQVPRSKHPAETSPEVQKSFLQQPAVPVRRPPPLTFLGTGPAPRPAPAPAPAATPASATISALREPCSTPNSCLDSRLPYAIPMTSSLDTHRRRAALSQLRGTSTPAPAPAPAPDPACPLIASEATLNFPPTRRGSSTTLVLTLSNESRLTPVLAHVAEPGPRRAGRPFSVSHTSFGLDPLRGVRFPVTFTPPSAAFWTGNLVLRVFPRGSGTPWTLRVNLTGEGV